MAIFFWCLLRFFAAPGVFTLALILGGCRQSPAPPPVNGTVTATPAAAIPGAATGAAASGAKFVDVAAQAGLHYQWVIEGKRPLTTLQTIGNGCAFLDYNNDGNLDILLVGPKLALYRGDGYGHFADVSHATGLDKLSGHFLGCATGDYDNDGYTDIYISAYQGGLLLHNEGGKNFRDVTSMAGLKAQPWGTSCAFADINNDGKLDLYVANYLQYGPNSPQLCQYDNILSACAPFLYPAERGTLYLNAGSGHFRDVTQAWGASSATGKALGVAFADVDGSGRQSLAIANDGLPGDLLLNRGQHFENIGVAAGVAFDLSGKTHAGMGIDWSDYDNHGRLSLLVTTFEDEPTCIYHNNGKNLFTEMAAPLGLAAPTLNVLTFGAKWFDYDNDGWPDLATANGHVRSNATEVNPHATYRQPSQLFHNEGGQRFVEVDAEAGAAWGRKIVGRGLAVGDYDNDGRVDVLIVDSEGPPLLLHNESPNSAHWLGLRLIGSRSNRDAIGAEVAVEAGGLKQTRRCGTDGSYLSASDPRVHFGLNTATVASTVTVRWPTGQRSTLHNVNADHYVTLRELD
ncbi:MAG: CRTAC1 family protein [Abitibacteriaceae bacterium]|nr:CRTAC1 family protein [Abditibacteriaceae bacterium]